MCLGQPTAVRRRHRGPCPPSQPNLALFWISSRISLWIANDVTHAVVMFSRPASAHTDQSRATTRSELSTVKTLPCVTMPEQQCSATRIPSRPSPAPAEKIVKPRDERLDRRRKGSHHTARGQVVAVAGIGFRSRRVVTLALRGWPASLLGASVVIIVSADLKTVILPTSLCRSTGRCRDRASRHPSRRVPRSCSIGEGAPGTDAAPQFRQGLWRHFATGESAVHVRLAADPNELFFQLCLPPRVSRPKSGCCADHRCGNTG